MGFGELGCKSGFEAGRVEAGRVLRGVALWRRGYTPAREAAMTRTAVVGHTESAAGGFLRTSRSRCGIDQRVFGPVGKPRTCDVTARGGRPARGRVSDPAREGPRLPPLGPAFYGDAWRCACRQTSEVVSAPAAPACGGCRGALLGWVDDFIGGGGRWRRRGTTRSKRCVAAIDQLISQSGRDAGCAPGGPVTTC